jgi:hypothetical protein
LIEYTVAPGQRLDLGVIRIAIDPDANADTAE